MAESIIKEEEKEGEIENPAEAEASGSAMEKEMSRKEKRKALKKMKRKQARREIAATEREEEEARLNDPEAQMRIRLMEQEEVERSERERKEFEEREKAWHEAMELKKKKVIEQEEEEEEERKRKALDQESRREQVENANEGNESDDWEYVEDGPAEIIWQGNEIIFKKKKIRVPKKKEPEELDKKVDANRPVSNPLPPESEAFPEYRNSLVSAQDLIDSVAQQVPNFGTEQDKAHCPFHLKTGACRFGQRCSRVHFYPDKSCTLLIKNMYNGPGLAWEQDEGLEVCRNGSSHLRGNVYVHFKSLDSAVLAHHYINGRFFAGKQINCEFVNITRWKVAICGEYMKSRFKTCSRGMACNFIHCFRNPGGDYEWADSDKPPPRYWFRKMAFLFGYFDESACERQRVPENLDQPNRSGKISTADADRHRSRRSGSRETDHLQHSGSGRRKNLDGYVQRKADQHRSTMGGKEEIGSFNEDVREESMRLKLSHHRKRKHHTDTEDSYDDGGQISGDEYHDYTRKRSRKNSDNKNTPESDIDGDWLAREREKERHHGGTRKSSKYHRKTEKLDDYGDHESRDHEVYEDMRNKGRDGEAYHGSSSRRSHKKAGYPGDPRDSKNRSHDADRERLDKDSDGNRHCSRGRSSGLHRKVEKFWDDHDRNGNRDEWLDIDEARHGSYSRGHLDEALAFSDDGEPAKRLKDRRGHSSRDISKADSCDENLRSDRSRDSSCSSQCDERFDSRYNFDVQIEKRDRWEPEQHSYERRHKSSGKDSNSEYDSEPYYSSKARNDYPAKSEATALKHHKSKRKSDRRSRSSCKLSHRRHRNSSDEGLF